MKGGEIKDEWNKGFAGSNRLWYFRFRQCAWWTFGNQKRESKKIPLTHRNAKSGLLTGKNKDSELKQKVITLNNGKILKTFIHFQSNSTLDKKSSVIQNRKEIKGIKIEGFEQLLSNNYTSRGSSNSQRSAVGNKSTSSRKKVKELVHSPFNKGYISYI